MINFLKIFLILFSLSAFPKDIEETIQEKELENSQNQVQLASILQQKGIVLIAGLLNERKPDYFGEIVKLLKEKYHVSPERILVLKPDSKISISENADLLTKKIESFATSLKLKDEDLIIAGHSKGAVESVLASIEIIQDRPNLLDKIILLQGAFGGSIAANLICGSSCGLEHKLGPFKKVVVKAIGFYYRILLKQLNGIQSLRINVPNEIIKEELKTLNEDQKSSLDEKVFYLRSIIDSEGANDRLDRFSVGLVGQMTDGENDNTLTLDAQNPGLGQDLGTVKSNHSDLVNVQTVPVQFQERNKRRINLVLEIVLEKIYATEINKLICREIFQ